MQITSLFRQRKNPRFEPRKVIYLFYPELKIVDRKESGTFDILLLGSSVLNRDFGDIEDILFQEFLKKKYVKIYNLSVRAHTLLDAYYKYQFLLDRKFNLVILYEGINEVRANNCPDVCFKDDYSHYYWYKCLNAYDRHKEIRYILFPYYLHYNCIMAAERLGILVVIPGYDPKKEWVKYGKHIKTAVSFRRNIENILKIAGQKNERVYE